MCQDVQSAAPGPASSYVSIQLSIWSLQLSSAGSQLTDLLGIMTMSKGKPCHSAATKGKHLRAYLRSPASFGKEKLNAPPEVSPSWHGLVLRAWANKHGPTV